MIIIISFLFNSGRCHRNIFPVLRYSLVEVKVQQPYQVLSSPHSILSRETFPRERTRFEKQSLLLSERYTQLFWVSYEDAFIRFGFELISLKLFHISVAPPKHYEM